MFRHLFGGMIVYMGRSIQVPVSCAVCATAFTVKPSRARQNAAITCSKECIGALRSRNRIKTFGSAETRLATCMTCGVGFERKPSQLAKYKSSYCSRACGAVGKLGPKPELRNGEWLACEGDGCDATVWRTPATVRPHNYCSRVCSANAPRGPRVERIIKHCATCSEAMILIPSDAARYQFCSWKCAAITTQGRRRGLPGNMWTDEQRATLSATLREKYRKEWQQKADQHSARMSGAGNPQWRDGAALKPYARGFTKQLKEQIAERDGYVCQICGAPRESGTHVVHHIDGAKTDHHPSNLVLLCKPCHGKLHAGKVTLVLAPHAR